jgi:hypothetical protein
MPDSTEPTEEERMAAARARAEWELGDPSWAGVIIGAYLHPREDAAALADDRAEHTSTPDPWTDPDAAAAHQPPPF